jgi:hypothetical protein
LKARRRRCSSGSCRQGANSQHAEHLEVMTPPTGLDRGYAITGLLDLT